jgi:hypothetical protein
MTDPSNPPQDKKILVDEDWKATVEAEKEALSREAEKKPAGETPAAAPEEDHPLPPPTLVDLAGSLAVQTMIALGVMANPLTGKAELRIHQARHLIDTLDLLQKKTEGNRTAEETDAFDHLLHELRLGFLAVQSGTPQT